MIETAFYDTKPYDRHFFTNATERIRWRFHEFRLSAATAAAAQGAQAVCVFVKDLSDQVLLDDLLPRLLSFHNVLVTAHQAFFTHEALPETAQVTPANVLKLETGEAWLPGTAL